MTIARWLNEQISSEAVCIIAVFMSVITHSLRQIISFVKDVPKKNQFRISREFAIGFLFCWLCSFRQKEHQNTRKQWKHFELIEFGCKSAKRHTEIRTKNQNGNKHWSFKMRIRNLQFGSLVAAFFLLLRIQYVSNQFFIYLFFLSLFLCFFFCFLSLFNSRRIKLFAF